MSKLDKWIDNKVLQNFFIWFCLFLILLGAIQSEDKIEAIFFIFLVLVPAVYINNIFILPLLSKSTQRFLFFFFLNSLIITAISVFFLGSSLNEGFQLKMFINLFGIMLLALIFGAAIKLVRDSFIRRQEEKDAELKLLKAQLNPHFLFNTLNNLYGLSVVKSDKLPSLMLKLSDLLRYSLYDTKDTFVPLEKEIQYLENYMSLEKIRLEDKTDIQLNKEGSVSSKTIAPMLLIVFVENAFKHLGELSEEKSKVLVFLKIEENQLFFTCTNTVDTVQVKEPNIEKGKSGIGLKNAKKRLDLMYAGKYKLTLKEEKENYVVKLILDF